MMVGTPTVDAGEGVETAIGDPLDGCQETAGDSRVGVVGAIPRLEVDGARAGVEVIGGVGVVNGVPMVDCAAGCTQWGTGVEPAETGVEGAMVGAWATTGGAMLGA